MVKRLRRSPLTAETGVRFPVGVPNKKERISSVLFYLLSLWVETNICVCKSFGSAIVAILLRRCFPVGVPKQKDGQIDRPFVLLFPLEYEHRRGSDDFDGQTIKASPA